MMMRLPLDDVRAFVANFALGCPKGTVSAYFQAEGYSPGSISRVIRKGLMRGILSYGEEGRLIALERDD